MPQRGGLFKPMPVIAIGHPPKRAVRRERPSRHDTTARPDKAATPKHPEPKPTRRRSNYSIRECKRNPALARAGGPRREEQAAGLLWPRTCLSEVPARFRAAELALNQAPAQAQDRRPPRGAEPHKPVAPSWCIPPRPIRPGRPMLRTNRISFSYTIPILKLRKSSTPKMRD